MGTLLGSGFEVPVELRKPTALASANYYDQIALRTQNKLVEIRSAGCFPWQNYVFREEADFAAYQPYMPSKTKAGKAAKTDLAAFRNGAPGRCQTICRSGVRSRWISRIPTSKV